MLGEDIMKPQVSKQTRGIAPAKLKKVEEAEALAKPPEEEPKTDAERTKLTERLNKAVKIYTELCLTSTIDPEAKVEVIVSFLRSIPEEGREMLIRIRDMIPFCKGQEQDRLVRLLVLICKNPCIDSHERSITATTLYNHAFLDVCFECFEAIAADKAVLVQYRVEACRYLFGSEIQDNKEISQECLIEILESMALPSDYRYKIITGFISRTGFSTFLNTQKIRIPYDEEFVYGLQSCFFYEEKNGVRERILSGQHMLGMKCVEKEEKDRIATILLGIAEHEDYEENIRADAADVILRLGTTEQVEKAREIITNLGYSALGKGNKKNILDRVKTIYSNTQNIHDETIAECVVKFIEKLIKNHTETRPYHEVQQEVVNLLKARTEEETEDGEPLLDNKKKFSALSALNRVSIDTATFTKHNVSISEVFIHVWTKIVSYPASSDVRKMLENRLIEELVEMGDTCSSGHAGRFVNVLSAVDADLRISYESQIVANIAGRINARIRAIEDSDLKASISMGMLPDAEEEDVSSFKNFISTALPELHDELYKEFVGEKYISDEEFEKFFASGAEQWKNFGENPKK